MIGGDFDLGHLLGVCGGVGVVECAGRGLGRLAVVGRVACVGVADVESVAGVAGVGVATDVDWLCFIIEGGRHGAGADEEDWPGCGEGVDGGIGGGDCEGLSVAVEF